MVKVFLKGLTTGLILQIAIGPVFFYLANIALNKTLLDGLFAVLAATVVDYIYIALAIAGIGKLLEQERVKRILGLTSAIVLILFGFYMAISALNIATPDLTVTEQSQSLFTSFISTFILTISSPLTIVFWTGVFASRSLEYSFSKQELLVFGLAAGLSTFLFLGLAILLIIIFKAAIPLLAVQVANILVSLVLIAYGAVRAVNIARTPLQE
jgi:threonine/homoserine/homoserine lactone efflux protein